MNLKITNPVSISIGGAPIANLICDISQHCNVTEQGGYEGPVEIRTWIDNAAYIASKDQVYPIYDDAKIVNVNISLTQEEFLAANLPLTIYQKTAESMEDTYGLSVEVEF
jgi:hypothetical protein